MALVYYAATQNFGDALNRCDFWQRLIPDFDALTARCDVLGIGTILSRRFIRPDPTKLVLGSGFGYHQPAHPDLTWRVMWVRGPLTARRFALPSSAALSDPAYLLAIARPDLPWQGARSGTVLMPHIDSDARADFRHLATLLGYTYCSPTWPLERIVATLTSAERVVSESLHGAILADLMGVPWHALVTHHRINAFKWHDWCASIGLSHSPIRLSAALVDIAPQSAARRGAFRLEVACANALPWFSPLSRLKPWRAIARHEYPRFAAEIAAAVHHQPAQLSDRAIVSSLQGRMLDRLCGLAVGRH
jgi:succinoglycan biosynthesis protein ExoV